MPARERERSDAILTDPSVHVTAWRHSRLRAHWLMDLVGGEEGGGGGEGEVGTFYYINF